MEVLHFNRKELHRCYDLLKAGICLVKADAQGTILFANRGLVSMYDCASEEEFLSFTTGRFSGMYTGDTIPLSNKTEAFRISFFSAKRHLRTADVQMEPVLADGEACYVLEVENRRMLSSEAEDTLTGFPGTDVFLNQALEIAQKRMSEGTFTAMCPVCFNVANFRGFNRENGMNAGNRCIAYIGTVLRRNFPEGIFTRTDAENFWGLVARKDISERLDSVCAAVNLYLGRRSYALKAGVVVFDQAADEETLRHSFDMAQIACNRVKNDGEHSYAVFSKQMEEQLEMRRYILDHFDQALEEGYIKIYYQPVVRTLSGKVCSCEALARWEDPQRGMISPGVFVPVLESARRIGRLDQYMIEHVVQYQNALLESGRRAVPVSLNLSQLDFDLIQPLKYLNEMTEKYHMPHSYFHVEITETVLAENQERMARMIDHFHADGYEVWLDDFGSGYSSLKSLSRYPFDLIKLDMGFFRDFDAESREIVTSVVMMAKRLGMHTLAEGVETREQIDFLKKIGCEKMQGYFYGKPIPGHMIHAQLNQKGLQLESGLEASVYDKAGLVDMLSEDNAYLFLMENGTVRLLAYNEALAKTVRSVGAERALDTTLVMSAEKMPRHRHFVRFLESVFDQSQATETFIENGSALRVQASFVAGVREFWVGSAHVKSISSNEISLLEQRQNAVMHNAVLLFDGIYHLDLEKDQIEVAACVHAHMKLGTVFKGIRPSLVTFCRKFVNALDQERFLAFTDTYHLLEASKHVEYGYVQDLFRIKRDDGSFYWTLFVALPVKENEHDSILIYERRSVFEKNQNRKSLLKECISSLEPQLSGPQESDMLQRRQASVLRAFVHCSGLPMFCMDQDGVFIAVNEKMLGYLGRQTSDEVIGLTPEELGNFVDAEELRQAERRVLDRGETMYYTPTLAVSGIAHRIPMTMFPWYDGNQIAGIAGYVHIWEEEEEASFTKDDLTGLLNIYGTMLAGSSYDGVYRANGAEYGAVYLSLHDAARISRVYGKNFLNRVICACADMLRAAHLPDGTTMGHLMGCRFVMIGHQADGEALLTAAQQVQNGIQGLDEIDGVACHFRMDLSAAYGSEASGFAALLGKLEERADGGEMEIVSMRELHNLRQGLVLSEELLDTSPQRIMLVDTENHDLLLINKALKRDLHLPEDFICAGRKCYVVLQGRETPCPFCPNSTLPLDRFITRAEKFMATGEAYDTREVLISWWGRKARLMLGMPAKDSAGARKLNDLLNDEIWANESITAGMAEKDPDIGIAKTINLIGRNLESQRLLIFEERDDGTVRCTYEWCTQNNVCVKQELQSVLQKKLEPLYRLYQDNKIVTIPDYPDYCRKHPDMWLPLEEIRNVISGHLSISGRSLGFSLVLNVNEEAVYRTGYVLYMLTDFVAVMIQNRDNMAAALARSEQDPMTEIGNRAGLNAYVAERKSTGLVTLIMGDVNGLKKTNDTEGHLAGDALICRIADILVQCTDREHVFRMGGDEFLVIQENMDETGAHQLIHEIKDMCHSQGMSISLGYAVHQGPLDDIDAVLKIADQSMYEDKGKHYHRRRSDYHRAD